MVACCTLHQICVADIAVRLAGTTTFGALYTYSELKRDVKRMLANAKKFNASESVLYQDAVQLEVGRSALSLPPGFRLPC